METSAIVSWIIIAINIVVTHIGFRNQIFFDRYAFEVDPILIQKQYDRLLTSGFLHVNWIHLLFNMLALYFFSEIVELYLGSANFSIIYIGSLISGNLLALFVHRNHGDYSAVGASGAVSGVIFSSIVLFPDISIGLFGLPFWIPGWIYGIIYVLFSIYGIKSQRGNIGHEAHLGGALAGVVISLLIQPSSFASNPLPVIAISLPIIFFLFAITRFPSFLMIPGYKLKTTNYATIEDRYNARKKNQQEDLNRILDKINEKGIDSLTKKEHETLKLLSKQ